jgi:hypothetical protein
MDIHFDSDFLCSKLAPIDVDMVKSLGIDNLLSGQHILYKYCMQENSRGRIFF